MRNHKSAKLSQWYVNPSVISDHQIQERRLTSIQSLQRMAKRQRTKFLLSIIPCFCIILLLVMSAYYLSSYLFSWERLEDDSTYTIANNNENNEDFVDYEDEIDMKIANDKTHEHRWAYHNDDPTKLLDLKDFKYLFTIKDIDHYCSHSPGYKLLLVLIISTKDNYASRKVIRKTFGSLRKYRRWEIRTVFLIPLDLQKNLSSVATSEESMQKLKDESQAFGDIIVGKLPEMPKAKVYTQAMGYKWVANECKGADFIVKALDHVYIDLFNVVNIISHHHSDRNVLLCNSLSLVPVNHDLVTFEEFSADIYPPHCSDAAQIMSVELAQKFYFSASNSSVFWLEPVWITGIIREKLGVKAINIEAKYLTHTFRSHLQWALNGAFGENKTVPWAFIVLPRLVDVQEDVVQLWDKVITAYSDSNAKSSSFELNEINGI